MRLWVDPPPKLPWGSVTPLVRTSIKIRKQKPYREAPGTLWGLA